MWKIKKYKFILILAALLIICGVIIFMNLGSNRYISTFNSDNK
jgi:uncharacterized membrane protein HdeD (DUF308 family)